VRFVLTDTDVAAKYLDTSNGQLPITPATIQWADSLDFDLRRDGPALHSNTRCDIARTGGIGVKIEECHSCEYAIIIYGIRWGEEAVVGRVHDLGGVGHAEGFCDNDDGVVYCSECPLIESRLIGRGSYRQKRK
jgi:hypothetical protein